MENVQAGWFLLSFCACVPDLEFAAERDRNVWSLLAEILRVRDGAIAVDALGVLESVVL